MPAAMAAGPVSPSSNKDLLAQMLTQMQQPTPAKRTAAPIAMNKEQRSLREALFEFGPANNLADLAPQQDLG